MINWIDVIFFDKIKRWFVIVPKKQYVLAATKICSCLKRANKKSWGRKSHHLWNFQKTYFETIYVGFFPLCFGLVAYSIFSIKYDFSPIIMRNLQTFDEFFC